MSHDRSPEPPTPVRMCVRCERITDDPVMVHEVHSAGGPGWNVYACRGCAPHFPPPIDVFDLLPGD
ncbi:hypothetical protein AB0I99_00980 [Streptomyces spongiicola]|uniref:hypothetical protein n=1 Tax=Streptomyces spongiicola TaxID=1690221 RepID=UPI0033C98594